MSLTLEAKAAAVAPCRLGQILSTVPDNEAQILKKAVDDNLNWSAQALSFRLKKTQYPVGATTIKIHRRQECGCFL